MRPPRFAIVAFWVVATLAAPAFAGQSGAGQPSRPTNGSARSAGAPPAPEQTETSDAGSTENLQKAVQNPVSNLISVPFQDNLDYDIGPHDRARNTLNIEPVIPLRASERWNVITRTIVPFIDQPDVMEPVGGTSGLGDINPTFFLSPAKPGKLIWGIGPTFLLPTATRTVLGAGKWCAGPSAVLLVQPKPWTIGVLTNALWSFAGEDDRPDVGQLLIQYFVSYNLPHGWYLTSSPIITASWEAAEGDEWLVPFGGGVGKIFKLWKQPLNGQITTYYNAVTPDEAPSPAWQLRVQLAFLFPR